MHKLTHNIYIESEQRMNYRQKQTAGYHIIKDIKDIIFFYHEQRLPLLLYN